MSLSLIECLYCAFPYSCGNNNPSELKSKATNIKYIRNNANYMNKFPHICCFYQNILIAITL